MDVMIKEKDFQEMVYVGLWRRKKRKEKKKEGVMKEKEEEEEEEGVLECRDYCLYVLYCVYICRQYVRTVVR